MDDTQSNDKEYVLCYEWCYMDYMNKYTELVFIS